MTMALYEVVLNSWGAVILESQRLVQYMVETDSWIILHILYSRIHLTVLVLTVSLFLCWKSGSAFLTKPSLVNAWRMDSGEFFFIWMAVLYLCFLLWCVCPLFSNSVVLVSPGYISLNSVWERLLKTLHVSLHYCSSSNIIHFVLDKYVSFYSLIFESYVMDNLAQLRDWLT